MSDVMDHVPRPGWIDRWSGVIAFWKSDATAHVDVIDDELRRLAETSPHLLDDIGFRPARAPGTWRRGACEVTITHRPPASP